MLILIIIFYFQVKRKKASHAGMFDIAKTANRPMIHIGGWLLFVSSSFIGFVVITIVFSFAVLCFFFLRCKINKLDVVIDDHR